MKEAGLTASEVELVRGVLRRHPEVVSATLFGSRAKGTHTGRSDVDLSVKGAVNPLRAEAIAAELEDLPLPYQFEVQAFDSIRNLALREHIERVGIMIYQEARTGEEAGEGEGR